MKERSLFWPLVLIATGLLWLLINLGFMPAANLWALINVFPYFLMAVGVGLVLRSRWVLAGRIVSALTVAGVTLAVIFAAPLGLDKAPDWGCVWGDSPLEGCKLTFTGGGAVRGSGVIVSEPRQVDEFTGVSVEYPAEVVIQQGEAQSVTVEADDNLLPQLGTRVSGGVLHIENRTPRAKRVNPTRLVRVSITVTDLRAVDFSAAGSVRAEGFESDSLKISLSGAGEVTLSGLNVGSLKVDLSGAGRVALTGLTVRSLEVDLSGAGNIEANGTAEDMALDISGMGSFRGEELSIQTARVDISGAGNATLWVARRLRVDISGAGSVNYYGSPQVEKDISGVGGVHKLGDK